MKVSEIRNELRKQLREAELLLANHAPISPEDRKRWNWKPDANEIHYSLSKEMDKRIAPWREEVDNPPPAPRFGWRDVFSLGTGLKSRREQHGRRIKENAEYLDKAVKEFGSSGTAFRAAFSAAVEKEANRLDNSRIRAEAWMDAERTTDEVKPALEASADLSDDAECAVRNVPGQRIRLHQILQEAASVWRTDAMKFAGFDAVSEFFRVSLSDTSSDESSLIREHPVYTEKKAALLEEISEHPLVLSGDYRAYGHIYGLLKEAALWQRDPVKAIRTDMQGKALRPANIGVSFG